MVFKSDKQRRGFYGQPKEFRAKSLGESHGKVAFKINKKGKAVVPRSKMDWDQNHYDNYGNQESIDEAESIYHNAHNYGYGQNRISQSRLENARTNYANPYLMFPQNHYDDRIHEDDQIEINDVFHVPPKDKLILRENKKKFAGGQPTDIAIEKSPMWDYTYADLYGYGRS
jgi:hypothetical protein